MRNNDPIVQRAALPEILLVPDVALALGVKHSAARKAILRGDCGPFIRVGRRLGVLRDSFLETLAARQQEPERPPSRPEIPAPKPEYLQLLQSRKRRPRK
jgi:hypothetical protein